MITACARSTSRGGRDPAPDSSAEVSAAALVRADSADSQADADTSADIAAESDIATDTGVEPDSLTDPPAALTDPPAAFTARGSTRRLLIVQP